MARDLSSFIPLIEPAVLAALSALVLWAAVSGIDDLFIFIAWALHGRRLSAAFPKPPRDEPEKRLAIYVPLWQEAPVIRQMVEHNVGSLHYAAYEFFLGVYPNDAETLAEACYLEARHPNVHVAVCPHPGPTSKADCLNSIHEFMRHYEMRNHVVFAGVVTHDAEDVIHPESMRWISYYLDRYAMVQVPVLPLPTPFSDFVHGVYCDEFAEYQTKDIPARMLLGGFIPSNGVGTGYSRAALADLAYSGRKYLFDPEALTEDYENGYRLHRHGHKQAFIPLALLGGNVMATREYFPRTLRTAIKQRTRWITGIVLQSWQRHGWRGSPRERYWWWRDRKGIVGNPLSILSNVLTLAIALHPGGVMRFVAAHPVMGALAGVLMLFQSVGLAARMAAAARVYGWRFALGVPLRVPLANAINTLATFRAIAQFAAARRRGERLAWLKTDHAYPARATLMAKGATSSGS